MSLSLPSISISSIAQGAAINCPKGGVIGTLLTANTPKLIALPTWAAQNGSTYYPKFVVFGTTDNIFASYVYNSDGITELSELVTNGAFASDTSWTKGTGWTIAAGVATSDASQAANADLSQTPTVVVENEWYYVTFTITAYTAGNVRPVVGGTAGTNRASAATFSEYIKAGSDGTILLRADLDFAGSIDNFSAVPAAHIPTTDDTTGRASEFMPTMRDLSGVTAISIVSAAAAKVSLAFYKA